MRKRVIKDIDITTVLYKTPNALLINTRRNEGEDRAFIIAEGCSMSVNDYNKPYAWDPFLTIPNEKEYKELKGDIIQMYFPFECRGLYESEKDLSYYINFNMKKYKDIVLIGHSKGGVCFADMARMLERKTAMLFVSSPFLGTIVTDAEKLRHKLNRVEYGVYWKYYSQHLVDLDIMSNSYYLKNADFSGVKNHMAFNIISECKSIYSPLDLGCKYLNSRLGFEHGDGIVDTKSQKAISQICSTVKNIYIDASHANSLQRLVSKNRYRYIIS